MLARSSLRSDVGSLGGPPNSLETKHASLRKPYPSDLSDQPWVVVEFLIPVSTVGRPREVDMCEVVNAIFYFSRSGCPWDMLPSTCRPRAATTTFRPVKERRRLAFDPRRAAPGRPHGRRPRVQPERRKHRHPDGQGDRSYRQPGLRRWQENLRTKSTCIRNCDYVFEIGGIEISRTVQIPKTTGKHYRIAPESRRSSLRPM